MYNTDESNVCNIFIYIIITTILLFLKKHNFKIELDRRRGINDTSGEFRSQKY